MSTTNNLLPPVMPTIALHRYHKGKKTLESRKQCITIKRKRRSFHKVFDELGRNNFRNAYRLEIQNVFKLYLLIKKEPINTMECQKWVSGSSSKQVNFNMIMCEFDFHHS